MRKRRFLRAQTTLRHLAWRGSPQRKVLIGTVAVALTAATIAFMPPALAQGASIGARITDNGRSRSSRMIRSAIASK